LVNIAPAPIFSGLERLDDRVLGFMKVLGGVLVFGRIAAADVAAFQTQAQVHPGVSHFEAFFAATSAGSDFAHLIRVCAACSHIFLTFPALLPQ
jgi:hypothetical protein